MPSFKNEFDLTPNKKLINNDTYLPWHAQSTLKNAV